MGKKLPLFIGLTAALLSGCGASPQLPDIDTTAIVATQPEQTVSPETVQETLQAPQLMAFTDSPEAARQLAGQYGITFVSWQDGLALFVTQEEPSAVIRRGKDAGLPELSENYRRPLLSSEKSTD